MNSYEDARATSPEDGALSAGTWNVKGITEVKIHSICEYMYKYGLDFVCLQETHAPKADYYSYAFGPSKAQFLVILSGADGAEGRRAGVGFIVAPWTAHLIHGFLQWNERLAILKLKIKGGKVSIVSA